MDNFSEELVRGETARTDYMVHTGENVALLVDSSERMHSTRYSGPVSIYKGLTLFEVALRQLQDIVASRLAFAMETDITIIFYNTSTSSRDLQGVHVWHSASPPSVELLERLHDHDCSAMQSAHHRMASFQNGVVAAILEFYDGKISADIQLVIAAWTSIHDDEDDDGSGTQDTIVELLRKRDALLQLICVDDNTPEDVKNSKKMFGVFSQLEKSRRYYNTRNILKDPFHSGDVGLISHTNKFRIGRFRGKMKHNSFTLPLYLKSYGTIDMKCSSLTAAAWPKCVGSTVWLDSSDSSALIGKLFEDVNQATVSHGKTDTEEPEGDDPYYPKQAGKKEPKVPRVYIPKDYISQLRYPIQKKCAFLIGFKPKSWLDPSWQMREAYFIRPDDHSTIEMREKCGALHREMKEKQVIGVCCFTKSDQSEPRLGAILPLYTDPEQAPLGFTMVDLPFADDIRHPEQKSDALGHPTESTHGGISIAENVIRKFPAPVEYHPGVAINPHIQAHFSVLNQILLDQEEMGQENPLITDIMTDLDSSLVEALNEFKEHHLLH